jgi:CRISPR-associated protein Cmr4
MFRLAKPFFMRVITPLHAGSGQDLGIVDMPIQRERHTGYPKIEGSGLKGSIRSIFCDQFGEHDTNLNLIFGSEKNKQAGSIGFIDARILLFPVKSVKGVFAYVTCPDVLKKLKESLEIAKQTDKLGMIEDVDGGGCFVTDESKVIFNSNVILENKNAAYNWRHQLVM